MMRIALFTILSAVVCAGVGLLLTEGLREGAFLGAIVGGSVGVVVSEKLRARSGSASFKAGVSEDDINTLAGRNLPGNAYLNVKMPNRRDDLAL